MTTLKLQRYSALFMLYVSTNENCEIRQNFKLDLGTSCEGFTESHWHCVKTVVCKLVNFHIVIYVKFLHIGIFKNCEFWKTMWEKSNSLVFYLTEWKCMFFTSKEAPLVHNQKFLKMTMKIKCEFCQILHSANYQLLPENSNSLNFHHCCEICHLCTCNLWLQLLPILVLRAGLEIWLHQFLIIRNYLPLLPKSCHQNQSGK